MKSFNQYLNEKVYGTYVSDGIKASVDDIIKLSKDIDTEERTVAELIKTNHDVGTKEGLYSDLLEKPTKAFMKRVDSAEMKYPILIDENDYIIDGAHRLAKAYFAKKENIKVKVVSKKLLKQASELKEQNIVEFIRREGDQYVVRSEKGKNMGKFGSKKAAANRLRQIEYFKHAK